MFCWKKLDENSFIYENKACTVVHQTCFWGLQENVAQGGKTHQGQVMATIEVKCIHCDSSDVIKQGKTEQGKQRYRCRNAACDKTTFILDYSHRGWHPEIKRQLVDMAVNGSGVRDTSRVLGISQGTVIETLKKRKGSSSQWIAPIWINELDRM